MTVEALRRLAGESAAVSALTRPTVGVMGSVRTGMFRVAALTVRVSAFTCTTQQTDENKVGACLLTYLHCN